MTDPDFVPDFHQFSWVVVNSSGGKDSQVSLHRVVQVAKEQQFPLDRVVISHQCLKRMEWEGTLELVREQARFYGIARIEVTTYRSADGAEPTLLDYARKRRMWPSPQQRWCTSEFKRGPGQRVITSLRRESPGHILQTFGYRADESVARSKKKVYHANARCSTMTHSVMDWLPVHHWSTAKVWEVIKSSGAPYHKAYALGMPRLSCVFCIYAPEQALMIAGENNPELLDEYCDTEADIGHSFRVDLKLQDIRERLRKGERANTSSITEKWNM